MADASPPTAFPAGGRGVALALGGGSALGWAHIGVLRVFQEHGIAIGAVAGTSIGSIAAICLAANRLDVMEEIARAATRRRMLAYLDPAFGRGALLGGRRILRELEAHLGGLTFADLVLPAAAIAADLATGEEVRLTAGPVIPAVRASIAIPSLFRPVELDGRTLIDGGMVANLPLAAARALAPALPLVAVDLLGDYAGHVAAIAKRSRERSALSVGRSAFLMLMGAQSRLAIALERPAILIRPAIGHIATGHFHRAEELFALGRAAAIEALPAIRAVALAS